MASNSNLNLDNLLSTFLPSFHLSQLPTALSWFLGYRIRPQEPIGKLLICWWAFLGGLVGILVVEGVFMTLKAQGAPLVVASFGASAVLQFNAINSPLAQPRNAVIGQFLSALVGVGVSKLFQLSSSFTKLRFLSGALSVGLSSAVMGFTDTIHPPAGATALLCSSDPEIVEMGWLFVGIVVLGSVLLVVVALLVDNVQRTFPLYWWTDSNDGLVADEEEGMAESEKRMYERIVIEGDVVSVPGWLVLESGEKVVLEALRERIKGVVNRRELACMDTSTSVSGSGTQVA